MSGDEEDKREAEGPEAEGASSPTADAGASEPEEGDLPELDDDDGAAIRALLKRSLTKDEPKVEAQAPDPELLRGVQRKIRQRSRGKFYADGWSTSQSRLNYALVAAVMLVTIVVVYLALGPMGVTR